MKAQKWLFIATLSMTLMGAKCGNQEEDPIPPDINGSWQWSCSNAAGSSAEEPLAASTICASQVPPNSSFSSYIKEHIQFVKQADASQPNNWAAYFAFGTCVDSQKGHYTYAYNKDTKVFDLKILNEQDQLTQSYTVETSADGLRLKQEARICTLIPSPVPEIKVGFHPKPAVSQIRWGLRTTAGTQFFTSQLQTSFDYLTPQIAVFVPNNSGYRVGYSVLHTKIDGSLIDHYAAVIRLYEGNTLYESVAQDLYEGASFNVSTPSGEVSLTAIF